MTTESYSQEDVIKRIRWYVEDVVQEEIEVEKHYIVKRMFNFMSKPESLVFIEKFPSFKKVLRNKIIELSPKCGLFKAELRKIADQIFPEDLELRFNYL